MLVSLNPPTQEPQSPAPGEPSGLSKWPLTKTDGSLSVESVDEILSFIWELLIMLLNAILVKKLVKCKIWY